MNFNSLLNDKIVDLYKSKAFAEDNLNVYQKLKFALERVENIVGTGENAGYDFLQFTFTIKFFVVEKPGFV